MARFDRLRRAGIADLLTLVGRGRAAGHLYDLGLYPAAVPADDGEIWGEVHETSDPAAVLDALDEIEGFDPDATDSSLYIRRQVDVTLDDGSSTPAWIYFYNAPIGHASRIPTGDYLDHFRPR
jgi:gamma-glutamylcyclotransferase (GGCT)/AIG2-like uncharacterized protein YtfP